MCIVLKNVVFRQNNSGTNKTVHICLHVFGQSSYDRFLNITNLFENFCIIIQKVHDHYWKWSYLGWLLVFTQNKSRSVASTQEIAFSFYASIAASFSIESEAAKRRLDCCRFYCSSLYIFREQRTKVDLNHFRQYLSFLPLTILLFVLSHTTFQYINYYR